MKISILTKEIGLYHIIILEKFRRILMKIIQVADQRRRESSSRNLKMKLAEGAKTLG